LSELEVAVLELLIAINDSCTGLLLSAVFFVHFC